MFIVWKSRPVKGSKKVPFLQDNAFGRKHPDSPDATAWMPLWCKHLGSDRVAWTALVVHAERRDGKPRQKLVHRLPTIRSCCVGDPFSRAAWWYEVDRTIKFWYEWNGFEIAYAARYEPAIRAKLRAVVPPPTRAGRRDFVTFRRWRERLRQARWAQTDPVRWRAAEEAARGPDETLDQVRRRVDDERRRHEQARSAAEASARLCADGWGRRPPVDLAERQERTRRAEAAWGRFEEAEREHETRDRRWTEGQERRQEEDRGRAEEQWRRMFEEQLGRPSGPPWYVVLGLSPTATQDEIKRRYRELAKRHHPDRKGGDEKQFVRLKKVHDDAMEQALV